MIDFLRRERLAKAGHQAFVFLSAERFEGIFSKRMNLIGRIADLDGKGILIDADTPQSPAVFQFDFHDEVGRKAAPVNRFLLAGMLDGLPQITGAASQTYACQFRTQAIAFPVDDVTGEAGAFPYEEFFSFGGISGDGFCCRFPQPADEGDQVRHLFRSQHPGAGHTGAGNAVHDDGGQGFVIGCP